MGKNDLYMNDFAVRSFRDIADGDYIAARMACRAALGVQFLWSSQQALEKYLKCILLLNRISGRHVRHSLDTALRSIADSGSVELNLSVGAQEFVQYIDFYGRFRYLEISYYAEGRDIVMLDRTVWELRRFCTLSMEPRESVLVDGVAPPLVRLEGGHLETIIDNKNNKHARAREALLWQNAFFGRRRRKAVKVGGWMHAHNAPLFVRPGFLDDVKKYVYIPKDVEAAYREAAKDDASPTRN